MKQMDISMINRLNPSPIMPVLFVGHGSPMNAIEENEFTATWRSLGEALPRPQAILCVSAHWETRGTHLTAMPEPKTIHDFGGFPRELFEVQYPAPGDPQLASDVQQNIRKTQVGLDYSEWGFDHGAWSVVKHLYPQADIPMIEMSIDHFQKPEYHYELAKELAFLRSRGVLIVGSGNIVHNLREVNWRNENTAYDWAQETSEKVKQRIIDNNHRDLIDFKNQGTAFQRAIPTAEHYIPLLYALSLQTQSDTVSFFNDKIVMGSLSMTGVLISPELS
ncbi:MAG: 4,5-DOPA dioxygenase extradiol [Bacteroidales bacterium]|nr:4,5-DOPA dioxygenase extradiol [Bacteroidales bacterium]